MTLEHPHILFMEDDAGVARLFSRKLGKLGYSVDLAVDGLSGIAMCKSNEYDLVAVDHSMPGMSGLDVIAELNKLEQTPPVIMVTGQGCERTAATALKMGAHDYIVKDSEGVFFDLIPSVITQILRKRQTELEQIRTEEALRESEARYRSLVECSPDGILVVVDGEIIFANKAAEFFFRADKGSLSGNMLENHVKVENMDAFRGHLEAGLQAISPATYKFETTIVSADGSSLDVEMAAVSVLFHGKPGLQLVLRDITGHKEAEAAVREMNEELEFILRDRTSQLENLHREIHRLSSNTAVDRKATDVLHNVKNVLNSLVVSTNTMERIIDNSKIGNVGKVANLMEENKGDLATFITSDKKGKMLPAFLNSLAGVLEKERDMLSSEIHGLIDHLEHINVTVNLQQRRARLGGGEGPLDVEEIIDEALKICNNSVTRYDIRLQRERAEAPMLQLDRHKIMQILVNLINNATRAVDDAGRPPDERIVNVERVIKDGRLIITVTDKGVGISEENMAKLFQYGFTTRKTGHGFGLHSCKILANEMEGHLIASSDGLGEGASFSLNLPARPPRKPSADEAQPT